MADNDQWYVFDDPHVVQVVPRNDTRDHDTCKPDHSCWCDPVIEREDGCLPLVIHNAHDGREAYEDGSRKPS